MLKTTYPALRQGVVLFFFGCVISTASPLYAQQQSAHSATLDTISPLMVSQLPETAGDSLSPAAASPSAIRDPWESFNRHIFSFNDTLDTNLLVPIAKIYNKIMPRPLNKGIYNAFSNLNNIPTISNDLLQGNFYQATADTWRCVINSTAGIGGLFDVAENMGLDRNSEDFGLTLARWGYTDSSYLVLPFFGPSTVRDTLGMPIDYMILSPYRRAIPDARTRYTLYALNILSKRAQLLQYQDFYNQFALDRYIFMRNAYTQQRNNAIERNQQLSDPYVNLADRSQHQKL